MPHHPEHDDPRRPEEEPSAYFFFPYFAGDDGTRPLPAPVVDYACPSLLVDGMPYAWSHLLPGSTIALSALVTNLGDMLAYGLVTFRWAEPTAQFSQQLTVAGQTGEVWLPGETRATAPIAWNVPKDIPPHACLLAEIDSPLDAVPSPAPLSPVERHYAQQNLIFVELAPGETGQVEIGVGNPSAQAAMFNLVVAPDLRRSAAELAATQRLALDDEAARTVQFRWRGREHSPPDQPVAIRVRPRSSQRLALVVTAPASLRGGQVVLLLVEQRDGRSDALLGTTGVAIVGRR